MVIKPDLDSLSTIKQELDCKRLKMQNSSPFGSFPGLNNNDALTANANYNTTALNELNSGVAGYADREEEYPSDLEMDGGTATQNLQAPVLVMSSAFTHYTPAGQSCVLNSVKSNNQISSIGFSNTQSVINSLPNFTFTTPTQSAMYSPPLVSSNHGYQFQRATPQTFSPTGCAPWQHSVPNRVPWMGQSVGLTVSSQGVSIFTAPLGSRANISWTNKSPQVTTMQDPSPSCSQIPRRPKRHSSENLEYLSPTNKVHLTERMIADHMRELSINNIAIHSANDKMNIHNTGITRPVELAKSKTSPFANQPTVADITKDSISQKIQWQAFRDLEERLEDVSDDELPNKYNNKRNNSPPRVVFLENIPKHPQNDVIPQKILDAIQKPSPGYELVLWQPPGDVVKDMIGRVSEKRKDNGQSQDNNNELFGGREDDSTMDLDLCEGDDMML